jgi:hypothetical protein
MPLLARQNTIWLLPVKTPAQVSIVVRETSATFARLMVLSSVFTNLKIWHTIAMQVRVSLYCNYAKFRGNLQVARAKKKLNFQAQKNTGGPDVRPSRILYQKTFMEVHVWLLE